MTPESLIYRNNVVPLFTYKKLKSMSDDELTACAKSLHDVVGPRLPPPPPETVGEDVVIWVLQVEVALAHGQDLRNGFGSPIDAASLGVPAQYIEGGDEPVSQLPTPQPSGAA